MLISVLSFIVGLTGAGLLSAGAAYFSISGIDNRRDYLSGLVIYDNPGLFLRHQQWRR
jgi:hypothetical protein